MNHLVNFDEQANCLNCGAKLTTRFCGECGQEKARRITFKELFKTAQRALLEFESPFLKTFITMTTSPGRVCRDYIEGKRAIYFNPIKYAFWSLTFFIFLTALTGQSISELTMSAFMSSTSPETQHFGEVLSKIIEGSMLFLTFIYVAIFALLLRVFFRKEGIKFTEFYILAILPSAHLTWFTSILVATSLLDAKAIGYTSLCLSIVFPIYTYTTFFNKNKIKVFFKSCAVMFLGILIGGYLSALHTHIQIGYEDAAKQHKLEHAESEKQVETNNL
ncbi:hypothetical protein CWB73_18050 [Pseudoalteromonas phenolica]|uniref:DUF3667 domain-containing protein n=1 Tax=Pseudoalteromonas phenolica TaxID=161398 RepID=A0A5S3YNI8_9GAMM|nr:hypothetical protein CWB73_18050 [Pseudoalteromonas phenolica]